MKNNLRKNQTEFGKNDKVKNGNKNQGTSKKSKKFKKICENGNQPPKNNKTVIVLIKRIFAYSAIKNKANAEDEYSTL